MKIEKIEIMCDIPGCMKKSGVNAEITNDLVMHTRTRSKMDTDTKIMDLCIGHANKVKAILNGD